jgi:hypothetical protein
MPLSLFEIRLTFELGFLPLHCRCTASASNHLTLELSDPETDASLVVGGISLAAIRSVGEVEKMIAEVLSELDLAQSSRLHISR